MSESDILDLGALVAASRDLATRSATIIKTIYEGGDLQVIDKAFGGSGKSLNKSEELKAQDPTTVADVTAQKLIIGSLQKQFPGLRICGEEEDTKVTEDDIVIPNMKLDKEVPEQYKDILVKDCCVWVDPIDGTKEYTEGIKEAVTTLIGIAHKGRPIAGVIGRPFNEQVIWGIVGLGAFGYNEPKKQRDTSRRIICTTRSHFKPSMKSYIAACNPTAFVRAGGSGGKVLMVIEGTADAYVFPSLGTKKWDTCAPEAVLLALGGSLTKPDGTLYEYDPARCEPMNSEGFIATVFDKTYHDSFLRQNLKIEQLDMTIFGATGFSGRLAAEYLCEKYLRPADSVGGDNSSFNYKFGLAGRNMNKLQALLNDLCKINENAKEQFQLIECNALNSQDVEKVARLSTVVITTVGPYARYGEKLIAACCKYGVDYVDLTGEYPWVKRMIVKYESEAIRGSARIVNFGGYVSAITDCGIYSLVNYMQTKLDVKKGEALIISSQSTIPTHAKQSGGTTESYFENLDATAKYDPNDVYFLKPDDKPYGPQQPNPSIKPQYFPEWQRYSFPEIYGPIHRMVFARSNAMLNYAFGKQTIFRMPLFLIKSFLMAWIISLIMAFVKVAIKYSLVRAIIRSMRNLLGPKPGEGPTREAMLKSKTNIYLNAETMDGSKSARLVVKAYGDLGYYLTSRILCEEGMIFVEQRKDKKRRKIKGGMFTPSVAVGEELLERLNKLQQFDISYEQKVNGSASDVSENDSANTSQNESSKL